MTKFYTRSINVIAGILLTLQGFVIWADSVMTTYFFDEVASFLICGALVYLIRKQRQLFKTQQ